MALATIIETKGSTPQIQGASAIFSEGGLICGTLGGGILEACAEKNALEVLKKRISFLYEHSLEDLISQEGGAICGGIVTILIDASPGKHEDVFRNLKKSLLARKPGILATLIENPSRKDFSLSRCWIREENSLDDLKTPPLSFFRKEIKQAFREKEVNLIKADKKMPDGFRREGFLFLEPLSPLPQLVIAGAGHIGQAVAKLGSFLNFEVTVIDDRPEFANSDRFPDADKIIVDNIGKSIRNFPIASDTYVIIVTRGHRHDAEALRECINREAAYIGMIGSRQKVSLMREKFLQEGWAPSEKLDCIYAPIGIDIHSTTVEEIAVSIAAQLVLIRYQNQEKKRREV